MPTQQATRSRVTTDHQTIRRWVEAHGGVPARVKGTGGNGDAGLLRIDFSRGGDNVNLEPISWEEFFATFERNRLAFLYHEESLADDNGYFKFVNEEIVGGESDDKDKSEEGDMPEGDGVIEKDDDEDDVDVAGKLGIE